MPQIRKIDHIGIATKSIEESLKFYEESMGIKCKGIEELPEQQVRVAMLPLGEIKLELLEPLSSISPIAKFLDKKGPGVHHIAFETSNVEKTCFKLNKIGCQLIYGQPKEGAHDTKINFIHPKSSGGVLLELVQKS